VRELKREKTIKERTNLRYCQCHLGMKIMSGHVDRKIYIIVRSTDIRVFCAINIQIANKYALHLCESQCQDKTPWQLSLLGQTMGNLRLYHLQIDTDVLLSSFNPVWYCDVLKDISFHLHICRFNTGKTCPHWQKYTCLYFPADTTRYYFHWTDNI
jgi:hypothetical protein